MKLLIELKPYEVDGEIINFSKLERYKDKIIGYVDNEIFLELEGVNFNVISVKDGYFTDVEIKTPMEILEEENALLLKQLAENEMQIDTLNRDIAEIYKLLGEVVQ